MTAKIKTIRAWTILDSRGDLTVEAEVLLNNDLSARASVPQGESAGTLEAVSLPVETAVARITEIIAPALIGMEVNNQSVLDQRLLELDGTPQKAKLGGNATLAVSLAAARAAARAAGVPLWQYLREISGAPPPTAPPRLVALLVEGGLHAPGVLPFQEYLLIPRTLAIQKSVALVCRFYETLREALVRRFGPAAARLGDEGAFSPAFATPSEPFAMFQEVAAAFDCRKQIDFGLDAAANQVDWPLDDLFKFYRQIRQEHQLFYLEDPFREDDFINFAKLHAEFGESVLIVGDDLTVSNVKHLETARVAASINAVIVKPNQVGTLTETFATVRRAREYGWQVIVSHRGRETNDDFIADLAYGLGADGFKLGAPARGERVAKYNRLLAIEREREGII